MKMVAAVLDMGVTDAAKVWNFREEVVAAVNTLNNSARQVDLCHPIALKLCEMVFACPHTP